MSEEKCRFCGTLLHHTFCDLGTAPLSNAYLSSKQLNEAEVHYPLHPRVCEACFLVQLPRYVAPAEIFSEYLYFSSFSKVWLSHVKRYAHNAIKRFKLDQTSRVIEIASNDGYLLEYFKQKEIPVLGVEPAENIAAVAREKGIETRVAFFGVAEARAMQKEGLSADLLIGNNVLAHVPDLHDFVGGLKLLLKPEGRITIECPHILQLIDKNQFDTIYHEHFSYFSFLTLDKIFSKHGLKIYDIEEHDTHGGSLRLYLCRQGDPSGPVSERIARMRAKEIEAGLNRIETYTAFSEKVRETRLGLLAFLVSQQYDGKTVVAYGAPAKGNTLLNYCGIHSDMLSYTVDRSPHKQGLYLPGSRLPIYHPDKIKETRPDFLLILPWNLKEEVMDQMAFIREWHGRFVVPIPRIKVFS